MKHILRAIVALMFISSSSNAVESPCYPGKNKRMVIGPEPLSSDLRKAAVKGGVDFFDDGSFNVEEFSYLGKVVLGSGKVWYIALLATEWGPACRYTPRLLIFTSEKKYLGQYSHFSAAVVKVEGNTIIFDSSADLGNRIIFTDDGPPKEVYIDGETHELYE